MSQSDEEEARVIREVAARAIRRLDLLEWVLFIGSALLAIGGGALVAWVLSASAELEFRPTWIVASIVLFVVPGLIALLHARREEHRRARRSDHLRRETEERE